MPGNIISAAEVTHVSKHGFWLLIAEEELLAPFEQFPWFRKATIEQLSETRGIARMAQATLRRQSGAKTRASIRG